MHACEARWCAARLEAAELARITDSALSLAAAPAPPLVFSEAEDEAAPADRQAWAQVWGLVFVHPLCAHVCVLASVCPASSFLAGLKVCLCLCTYICLQISVCPASSSWRGSRCACVCVLHCWPRLTFLEGLKVCAWSGCVSCCSQACLEGEAGALACGLHRRTPPCVLLAGPEPQVCPSADAGNKRL